MSNSNPDFVPAVTRNNYIHIARDLGYGEEYIARIKEAKSENEITRILRTAREREMEGGR